MKALSKMPVENLWVIVIGLVVLLGVPGAVYYNVKEVEIKAVVAQSRTSLLDKCMDKEDPEAVLSLQKKIELCNSLK